MANSRSFGLENYADFKLFVSLFGKPDNVIWAYSVPDYTWIMNISPVTDMAIIAQSNDTSILVLDATTIAADFPNSIRITTSASTTRVLGSGFQTKVYAEWKTVLSAMNFGGPIFWGILSNGLDFVAASFGSDALWAIKFYSDTGAPSSFLADFPNAIEVNWYSIK
jgi:hypothetical protein